MTADIINLRRARKDRARAERARMAARNRAEFGRTKAERAETAAQSALEQRRLDALRLGTPANEGGFPSTADAPGDDGLDPGVVS